ncbi:MAG TPA: hypothetical protein VJ183_08135 [Chloroflexia bacterium]|nr:hypothetical protein [Chloroflexia bacterium]
MKLGFTRLLAILSLFMLLIPAFAVGAGPSLAQEETRTFPETGKTVKGRFLKYWNEHGGLPQQGFPISEEIQEISDTDGKTYTVQYFERSVFEYHPDEKPEFQVLLSLLGTFFYQAKYGSVGAPNQTPNNEAGSVLVPETGKRLGGIFLKYWREHGGLAQQGYPVSDEFNEVSDLNGQTYKVQYFQRAVFEYHPEEQPAFQVLLSQLGTFQYRKKYQAPQPTVVPPTTIVPPTSVPATSVPTSVPPTSVPPTANPCDGIPPQKNMLIDSDGEAVDCGRRGTRFAFLGQGFGAGEHVGAYLTAPDGSVFGANFQLDADGDGDACCVVLTTNSSFPTGIWALSMEGVDTHNKAIGYFKLIP